MTASGAAQTWNDNDTQDESLADAIGSDDYEDENQSLVTDNMNIDMAVTSKVQLDVKPEALNYPDMRVGERNIQSERTFTSLNLQNTGSEYIDSVWMDASVSDDDPFRDGASTGSSTDSVADAHNAGNFMQIRPQNASGDLDAAVNSGEDAYHFINRKEFAIASVDSSGSELNGNLDQVPSFIETGLEDNDMNFLDFNNVGDGQNPEGQNPSYGGAAPGEVHLGSFRVADRDYYYALMLPSEGDATDGELRVADASFPDKSYSDNVGNSEVAYHDDNTFGIYDFSNNGSENEPIRYRAYQVDQVGSTSLGIVNGLDLRANPNALNFPGSESYSNDLNRTYDVVINATSGNVAELTRTRYNVAPAPIDEVATDSTSNIDLADVGENVQYVHKTSATNEMIKPGQSIAVDTGIEVPRGVVQGQVNQGTLTVALTSDNTQTPGQDAEEYIHTNQ